MFLERPSGKHRIEDCALFSRNAAAVPLGAVPLMLLMLLMFPSAPDAGYCLAGSCHAGLVSKRYLHGPVTLEKQAQGGCELCHVPDGRACTFTKGGQFQFANRWDDLCMGCHGGTIAPDHKLPARPCVICHDPHGSDVSQKLFRKGILHEGK